MAQVGLVKQTLFHSQTSQYGAMSRGMRFWGIGIKKRMKRIFNEINSGDFAKEWRSSTARLKLKAIRFFAMRQSINQVEQKVREDLGLRDVNIYSAPSDIQQILQDPEIMLELEGFRDMFEYE
jgi:ketol-acid reductoisomerase